MEPNATRWARLGPENRRWLIQVPPGGLCLSAFVAVENPAGDVLLGRPALHRAWPLRGSLPLWRVREIVRSQEWILPGSHLLFGEHPDHAAVRIARDWAGLPRARPEFVGVDSGKRPSRRKRGGRTQYHWDIGFLYRVRAGRRPPSGPWWAETRFMARAEWERAKVGRGHRDTLRAFQQARANGERSARPPRRPRGVRLSGSQPEGLPWTRDNH